MFEEIDNPETATIRRPGSSTLGLWGNSLRLRSSRLVYTIIEHDEQAFRHTQHFDYTPRIRLTINGGSDSRIHSLTLVPAIRSFQALASPHRPSRSVTYTFGGIGW